jgi:hypothetical protein
MTILLMGELLGLDPGAIDRSDPTLPDQKERVKRGTKAQDLEPDIYPEKGPENGNRRNPRAPAVSNSKS